MKAKPLTYYLLAAIAVVAMALGAWLIYDARGGVLSAGEAARVLSDHALSLSRAIGSSAPIPPRPATEWGRDWTQTAIGMQAVLGGVLLAGFVTVIGLLSDIRHSTAIPAPEHFSPIGAGSVVVAPEHFPGTGTVQYVDGNGYAHVQLGDRVARLPVREIARA